jgi:hypothetical protein
MDLGRAFGYVSEDERWITKLLIGGAVYIIGAFLIFIGPLITLGYMIQTSRNIAMGNPRPLPEWDDWGTKLSEGFKAFVVALVYAVPLILFMCIIGGVIGLAAGASADSESAGAAAGGLALCAQGLYFLLAIVTIPFSLAGITRFVQTGDIAASLRFGEVFAMVRSKPGTWLMLLLVYILCQIVGQAGAILCGIGLFFTIPYAQAVFAHILAQVVAQNGGLQGSFGGPPPSYTPPSYTPPTYQ